MTAPGSIANTLFKRNTSAIMEKIGTAAREMLPNSSYLFNDLVLSDATVMGPEEIGRDMKIKRRYYTGNAGVVQGGNLNDYVTLVGDTTTAYGNRLHLQNRTQVWPDPKNGPNQSVFNLTMTLYAALANLQLSQTEMALDATPANIKKYIAPKMKGFARQINLFIANQFFADKYNRLGSVGAYSTFDIDSGNNRVTFTITEGTISRFQTGQQVDLFTIDTSNVVRLNDSSGTRIKMFVYSVDPFRDAVTVQIDPAATPFASSGFITTAGDDAWLAIADTAVDAAGAPVNFAHEKMYGWRNFAIPGGSNTAADNRLLGPQADSTEYIDVDEHPEFKSFYKSGVGILTPDKFDTYLDQVTRAFGYFGHTLDTAALSHGILKNMLTQIRAYGGEMKPMRFSAAAPDKQVFEYTFGSRKMTIYSEDFLEAGTVLMLRARGNFEVVVPPSARGGGRPNVQGDDPGFSKIPLRSLLRDMGSNSDTHILMDPTTAQATPFSAMPCYVNMQIIPREQFSMAVLTGVGSTRTTNSDGPISTS